VRVGNWVGGVIARKVAVGDKALEARKGPEGRVPNAALGWLGSLAGLTRRWVDLREKVAVGREEIAADLE
jgi:hypothetical protein